MFLHFIIPINPTKYCSPNLDSYCRGLAFSAVYQIHLKLEKDKKAYQVFLSRSFKKSTHHTQWSIKLAFWVQWHVKQFGNWDRLTIIRAAAIHYFTWRRIFRFRIGNGSMQFHNKQNYLYASAAKICIPNKNLKVLCNTPKLIICFFYLSACFWRERRETFFCVTQL